MSEEQMTSVECTETEISEVISSQGPIIHLTENGVVGFEVLCRLCANRSDHLIPIYSEEGISNDLADKMNLYLPIKVAKTDLLPLQCCFQCASTVLTWHELIIASVEADKRLRDVQAEVEKQLAEHDAEIEAENEAGPSQPEHEKIFIEEDRCAPHENTCTQDNTINDHASQTQPQPSLKTYQCTECNKYFLQKLSLERHVRIHRDERPFICDMCGFGFRDKSGLNRHISHVHFQTKHFQCDICLQSFASAATRDDHQRIHTKQRPFVCQKCGKCFARKAGLYIHSKIHSDVFPFCCRVCSKKFRRRQELVAHSSTHSGERPYKCMECGKSFRIKAMLTTHLLVHSDIKPFTCDVCGMAYRQARYVKKHMKLKHCPVVDTL